MTCGDWRYCNAVLVVVVFHCESCSTTKNAVANQSSGERGSTQYGQHWVHLASRRNKFCSRIKFCSFFSLSYIGGNINYMGGGSMNMEYPFENHPGHYNLWKPPSGYFPRGEAPPPYEEAVALAQAESLNAQCTVR